MASVLMPYLTVPEKARAFLFTKSSCERCTNLRVQVQKNFKLLRRKGTLISFINNPGAVPPFLSLRFAEKNVKLLGEEGAHYFTTSSSSMLRARGILHEYPSTAKGVQQAQTDLPRGRSTGKLIVKIGDYTHGDVKSTHGMACVPMYSSAGR